MKKSEDYRIPVEATIAAKVGDLVAIHFPSDTLYLEVKKDGRVKPVKWDPEDTTPKDESEEKGADASPPKNTEK